MASLKGTSPAETRRSAGARTGDGAPSGRLPSLTGLRFIAAALVFTFHSSVMLPTGDVHVASAFRRAMAMAGPLGVGFFFVLSGFVLAWTVRSDDTAPRFWRRRIAKIYPNHLVTWLAALILLLRAGQEVTASGALSSLFLVQSWIPRGEQIFGMNDVSWSLSCEALFYLAFPLLYRYIRRIRPEHLWAWAAGVVAVAICVPLFVDLLPTTPLWFGKPVYPLWLVYVLPPVRMLDFVLGILMARIVRSGKWIPFRLGPACALVAVGYVVALYVPGYFGFVAVSLVPLALVIPAAATADLRGLRSPFRGRTMVWLGEISFAFYMTHRLVMRFAPLGMTRKWSTPEAAGIILAAFALSIVASYALYSLVERPMMKLIGRSRPRTRPVEAVEASEAG